MITLRSGACWATIDEARGGRLASVVLGGRELLIGPPDDADRGFRWGSFVMAPWVGRIERGELPWDGTTQRLPLADGPHAIHGLVYDRAWTVERATDRSATLSCRLPAGAWPAMGLVRQELTIASDQLVASCEVLAEGPMPAGLGWHPWFSVDDSVHVKLDASQTLQMRDLIPTGSLEPVDGRTDLRDGPMIAGRALDHIYADARPPATIAWPDGALTIDWDGPIHALVVHSTPTAVCIEPETAWPNAPALEARGVPDTGWTRLDAGGALRATMRWRWQPAASTDRSAEVAGA